MKRLLFLLMFLPCLAYGQNYLVEILPVDSLFSVRLIDDSKETFPRDEKNYGLMDSAQLQLFTYQLVEEQRNKEAKVGADLFLAKLKADQFLAVASGIVPLDYDTYASERWAGTFDGQYIYQSRDGNAINAVIVGYEVRRANNNNLLLTFEPVSSGFIKATTNAANPVTFNMYRLNGFFVGTKPNGVVVTLKKK